MKFQFTLLKNHCRIPCRRNTRLVSEVAFILLLSIFCSSSHASGTVTFGRQLMTKAKVHGFEQFNKNDAGSTGNLKLTNSQTYAVQPDPKHPGKFLWKIWAGAFTLLNPGNQITVTVQNVTALLFQDEKAAANLQAPVASYDNLKRTIDASGGVYVRSLSDPGTTLRADNVVFYAATNKIVASGHVVYHNGKSQMEIRTNELVADTKLKTLTSGSGGTVALPKGF